MEQQHLRDSVIAGNGVRGRSWGRVSNVKFDLPCHVAAPDGNLTFKT